MRVCEAAACHVSASLLKSIFASCRARSRATTDQAFLFLGRAGSLFLHVPAWFPSANFTFAVLQLLADDACSERLYLYHTLVLLSACLLSRSCPPAIITCLCRYTPSLSIQPILPLLARYAVTAMLRPHRRCTTRLYSSPAPFHFIIKLNPTSRQSSDSCDLVSPFIDTSH